MRSTAEAGLRSPVQSVPFRWRGLLVCAIDGTSMFTPDSRENVAVYGHAGGGNGPSGYPMLRLLTVVACGTRTVIDAVFGTMSLGEITYAPTLLGCLSKGMLLLADRNFAAADLVHRGWWISVPGNWFRSPIADGRGPPNR